ncbi:MAG TPA: MEDS domain-containing protein [Polyangia bacterium]|jgi:chemotaxis family two-component system sensor kinase Cph1|nr:MEDS domain-containing protein [Polyangia bacterium]
MEATIPRFGTLRPSEHVCFPYESDEDKATTLVAFIREGLARGERCLFIGAADDQHDLVARLEAADVAAERALERGALVLATQGETYLRTGRFDPEDALALMEGLTERALGDGFVGLRATGEASGPVPDELWQKVVRYEALLNERLGRRPFVGLCRFYAGHGSAERVRDVLRTHPHALVRGALCANPFYEPADVALGDDSRARLDWQLHQLRAHSRARRQTDAGPQPRDRLLSVLADELADPLFALKREVHALGAALDETPQADRLEAAARHLRRLTAAVEHARDVARLLDRPEVASSMASGPSRSRG